MSFAELNVIKGNQSFGENKNKEEGVSIYNAHSSERISVSKLINFFNSLSIFSSLHWNKLYIHILEECKKEQCRLEKCKIGRVQDWKSVRLEECMIR